MDLHDRRGRRTGPRAVTAPHGRPACDPPDATAVQALRARMPSASLITDPDATRGYARDQLSVLDAGTPAVVLRAANEAEISIALATADQHELRVVVRGSGSGLTGGANAEDGCLVICTDRLTSVHVDTTERTATAGAGTILAPLKRAVLEHGLFYPPDPASADICSLGGTIATNAGGLCCMKYGSTKDYLLSARVVLPTGEIASFGSDTAKRSVGLEVGRLLAGSEGTLGVITQATVRLLPKPGPSSTVVATLPTLEVAAAAVTAMQHLPFTPSLCELLDRTTVRAIDSWRSMDLETNAAGVLFLQCDNLGAGEVQVRAVVDLLADLGAMEIYGTTDADESDLLLTARKLAYPALERLGRTLLEDACVPRRKLVELLAGVAEIGTRTGLIIGCFGHVGDGNLHPTIVYGHGAPDLAQAIAAFDEIATLVLRLGGTSSGEHGIGRLKQAMAREELGVDVHRLTEAVRDTFDPRRIMLPR